MKLNDINLESVYPEYTNFDYGFSVVLSEDDNVEFLIKHTSEKILLYIYVIREKFVIPPYGVKGDPLLPFLDSVFLHYKEIMSILDIKKRQALVDEIVSKTIEEYSKKVFKWANYNERFKMYEHDFYTNQKFYIKKTEEGYKQFQFEENDNIQKIEKIYKRKCEICEKEFKAKDNLAQKCLSCWLYTLDYIPSSLQLYLLRNYKTETHTFDKWSDMRDWDHDNKICYLKGNYVEVFLSNKRKDEFYCSVVVFNQVPNTIAVIRNTKMTVEIYSHDLVRSNHRGTITGFLNAYLELLNDLDEKNIKYDINHSTETLLFEGDTLEEIREAEQRELEQIQETNYFYKKSSKW